MIASPEEIATRTRLALLVEVKISAGHLATMNTQVTIGVPPGKW